jgi:outer membrane lipoprotein-sorting protein
MKKLLMVTVALLAAVIINAQSLDEIVKNYTTANKLDKISNLKTLKITAKTSMMGMDLPVEMWMKNPDKIKTVTDIGGQKMIQAFDGQKGYTINPMAGSTEPVEMSADEVKQMQRNNLFQNYLANYHKEGKLTLEGEEVVKGSPAFKIKATIEGGTVLNLFIDKKSYMLAKTAITVTSQGMAMVIESFPSDFKDFSGLLLPMKTTSSASGMEFVTTFTNVEVDVPIDDSVFKLK